MVECDLAKVEVAGSNPVSRSRILQVRGNSGGWRCISPLNIVRWGLLSMIPRFKVELLLLTLLAALGSQACGSRKLTSVSVSPATAHVKDFPGGQVKFSATGTFSDSSKPVPLGNLTWCIGSSSGMCNGNIAAAATIYNNGVAQCLPRSTGTVTVLGGTLATSVMMPDQGEQLQVFGMARLTCP